VQHSLTQFKLTYKLVEMCLVQCMGDSRCGVCLFTGTCVQCTCMLSQTAQC